MARRCRAVRLFRVPLGRANDCRSVHCGDNCSQRLPELMPDTRRSHRRLLPDRRRALELLASCPGGCPEALMVAHGFTGRQLASLVRAGLATASSERMFAGKTPMEVTRVRITDEGRRALI